MSGHISPSILKYVHTVKVVAYVFPPKNYVRNLEKAVANEREKRVVVRKYKMFMIFFHEDFYKEVYYLVRWVTMTHYGPETDIFYG